jgi:hypothetical protein
MANIRHLSKENLRAGESVEGMIGKKLDPITRHMRHRTPGPGII